jgi:RecT family
VSVARPFDLGPGLAEARLYDQLLVVRHQIAPKATNAELAVFARVCHQLDLSVWAGQIVLIGRWDREAGRLVHRHQITVAGRRAIAARTGRLRGIEGPVWCGPRDDSGQLDWREVWDDDDQLPYCARVLVHVEGWDVPVNGTAKFGEFAQTDREGKLTPIWSTMPSHMIGKVAESLALRRAFPEVDQAVGDAGAWPDDVEREADDSAVLEEASARDEAPAPGGTRQVRPSTAGTGQEAAAPGSSRPVKRRPRPDEVPVEVYDNLPEAQR